jgi:hypothetical protein
MSEAWSCTVSHHGEKDNASGFRNAWPFYAGSWHALDAFLRQSLAARRERAEKPGQAHGGLFRVSTHGVSALSGGG